MRNIGVFSVILFSFLAISLKAQNSNFVFKSFTPIDGLSQSSVIDIEQDKIGQLWVGTRDGLNKFDGHTFKIYRNNPEDSTSISNSDILSIAEDRSGMLWVGTYNGLNKYNPETNRFQRYFHSNESTSLPSNTIWKLKEIKNEIWIGTLNGLAIYNKKTEGFTSVLSDEKNKSSLPGLFVTSIFESTNGDIWVGTDNGLCKLISRNAEQISFQTINYKKNKDIRPYKLHVKDIIEDKNHNLWVATKNSGLYMIKANTTTLISYQNTPDFKDVNLDIRAINFDKHNNLWIGTYSGIFILKSDGDVQHIGKKSSDYSGLNKIKTIFTDKHGSVWAGSYYGGLHLWDESNSNFINFNQNSKSLRLSYNVVGSIAASKDSLVFFGTEGGGITQYNFKSDESIYINSENTKGFLSDNIKSLKIVDDALWVGSFNTLPFLYDYNTKTVRTNNFPDELKNIFIESSVYFTEKENDSIIWFGTFGSGAIRYNTETKNYIQLTTEPEGLYSLTNNRVRTLFIDSKQRVWLGTQSGLNVMALSNIDKEKIPIKQFFFDSELISGVDILTVFEDSNRNIWVGTKASGFYVYKGETFEKVDIQHNGVKVNSVHSVLEDAYKNLWLSSNQGLVKYNLNTKNITIYDQTDGLISNEYNDNSSLNFNNDTFYFGGPAGVVSFQPDQISLNNYNPQVILTDFRIKNESVPIGGDQAILTKDIAFTKAIDLDYNNANFSIRFAIPNFINGSNNQYAYRMLGLEEAWNVTSNTEANYIIQQAGNYTFEVKGANNDDVWNEQPTILNITVHPAPWRSWWAFCLYALCIGTALIALISFLKSKAKLKHKLALESIEKQRNEEINQAKLQFFTNISHEFRTPLTLILGPLQQVLLDYKGSNKVYKKLLVIENSANHLLQLINRLMDFRKLENSQFNLQAAEGNIVKFLKEIYFSFSEYAKNGNYTYTFESESDVINVYYDRSKLERVFYNLISNAFRYTPEGGNITLKITTDSKYIYIDINDSGVGISDEFKTKIFNRFFEVPIHNQPQKNYNKGSGIGLSIAKNIAELHKGTIRLVHKERPGTIFRVSLPLGRGHLQDSEIISDFKLSDDISQYEIQLETLPVLDEDSIEDLITEKEKSTILIVEDHKPLRVFIKNLLKHDYNILEAENGKIALKLAQQNLPSLIISDVIMPEMVGTELCSKIKEDIKTSHIPVVLLTSRSSLIYKFEGLESGADEYISKPFNVKEFRLRIKNILENRMRLKAKFSNAKHITPSEITISSIDEQLLKKAFKIVEDNMANEQFDVLAFSQELGVSRTTLFNKIKAWTNFTPNEFIQEIRLKRAAQLLETNKINISQISYQVGFKSPKYFSKCFQKKFNETPSQYQNRYSEQF
ncbi:histidine kinase [Formosa agariphila KMM 3901]|uniref:Histidine kinase P4 n=1 Tax=Formosa agariphila (strain DSM 15362 / KCTC 12365 / LMG 23005 / KMM 3901 / M-2Alg 35-1) TaxID=1347342 RepID=PLH4_FORAG|nr:hybrid sensor histidine kinase/response regulator transcription factor [Formosa agariphila]T2KMF4.1 RecName: Full=Histidine kinase P4; Short=P4_HK; AltName: Full=Polysaccharide utilization locus H protein P4; Short=PUL H protein P4; Flags: Precursor [Formosa agariphila KMM 3901]CDF79905.1 histidine kinase [Formosa agariphila KMM 3901]